MTNLRIELRASRQLKKQEFKKTKVKIRKTLFAQFNKLDNRAPGNVPHFRAVS